MRDTAFWDVKTGPAFDDVKKSEEAGEGNTRNRCDVETYLDSEMSSGQVSGFLRNIGTHLRDYTTSHHIAF
jgi:hypothetical protein